MLIFVPNPFRLSNSRRFFITGLGPFSIFVFLIEHFVCLFVCVFFCGKTVRESLQPDWYIFTKTFFISIFCKSWEFEIKKLAKMWKHTKLHTNRKKTKNKIFLQKCIILHAVILFSLQNNKLPSKCGSVKKSRYIKHAKEALYGSSWSISCSSSSIWSSWLSVAFFFFLFFWKILWVFFFFCFF